MLGVSPCTHPRTHAHTHVHSSKQPSERVIQVRWYLPVITTFPQVIEPASFRDRLFLSSVHKVHAGLTRPQLHSGMANQSPFLGLHVEILGTGTFRRWLSKARRWGWSWQQPSTTPGGEPTYRGHQPRIKSTQRLEKGVSRQQQSLQIQPLLKPALPCTCQLKQPIISPCAELGFN